MNTFKRKEFKGMPNFRLVTEAQEYLVHRDLPLPVRLVDNFVNFLCCEELYSQRRYESILEELNSRGYLFAGDELQELRKTN